MTFIRSRKYPVTSRKSVPTTGMLSAATLFTGLMLALPAAATDAVSGMIITDAQLANAKTLPGVRVDATVENEYRVEKVASPKFTQSLLDTTQTISVITKDLLHEQAATTLTEALRNSPGVGTFYAGENGATSTGDSIYMRGFDTSGSIFVDGVRDLGSISRDLFNIEQIEVTKGPASTDNGRTAPTGAINMVSKQPTLHDSASATLAYGSAAQKRSTADWNHAISDHAAFRLNVLAQNSGVPGRHQVENNRWGVAPTLAFGLRTATRVYLDYLHVKQNNTPDGGIPTLGLPGYSSPDATRPQIGSAPMVNSKNFYGTNADHDDVNADMLTLRVEHDFNDNVALHNTMRWGRTQQNYLLTSFKSDATNLLTPDLADPSSWSVARNLPTFKDQTNRIVTNQTNVTVNFQTGAISHNLSTGIELSRENSNNTGIATSPVGSQWPAANLYAPNPDVAGPAYGPNGTWSRGKTNTASAYLFDTLKFSPRWQVNAGVRMDRYSTDFASAVVCGARNVSACGSLPAGSAVPGLDSHISGNLFNWKLGVLYKPRTNGSIYANFAVAAQPPGGGSLSFSSSASSLDKPNLDPEKARTTEVGTKWDLLDQQLLLTAALYRTKVSNQLAQDPVDLQYYQIGEKRVQGLELSAVGKLSENWSVSAGFTTMNATVTKGSNVTADGSDDLAYTPKSAFTTWTTYKLPFNLTIAGGARYSGQLKRGTDGAIGTPAFTEAYWVFDAMAMYPINKHVSLQLNIYNLFDKSYVAAINKSGYRYSPGAPRSAMLTANIRF